MNYSIVICVLCNCFFFYQVCSCCNWHKNRQGLTTAFLKQITFIFHKTIEIEIPHQHNIVCGVFYRHSNAKLDTTLNFLYRTIESLSQENKYCLLMGDFNLNLINSDSHKETKDFVNTLGSFSFHPQRLKPTRITEHSATLIDNIFF